MLILVKIFKLDITKFRTSYLNLEEWKKIINLFSVSILGWLSGLGFMNLAKLYADPENLATIGYILNIWNVFLLISTGINSVYNPLIKKYILQDNFIKAKTSKNTPRFDFENFFFDEVRTLLVIPPQWWSVEH